MKKILLSLLVVFSCYAATAQNTVSYRKTTSSISQKNYGGFEQEIISESIDGSIPKDYPTYDRGESFDSYKKRRVAFMTANSALFKKEVLETNRINIKASAEMSEQEYMQQKYSLDRYKITDPAVIEKSERKKAEKKAALKK